MKKLLLGSAAVVLGLGFAAPAHADGVELDLGGYFKGYGAYVSQDDEVADHDSIGMIRDTEVHFTGEYTLDNGLTVGAHIEATADGNDGFEADESYAYFSGAWGRVNAGEEDGAAYLLQVAAPSADSNYDGIRQYVQPFSAASTAGFPTNIDGLDYANDLTRSADKVTYLTPSFNGFQGGASYSFGYDENAGDVTGVNDDDDNEAWEIAARYEGQFDTVGFAIGAGFIDAEDGAGEADEWNIGLDLDWGAFGFGAAYLESESDLVAPGTDVDTETWVLGLDYTTGPYKLGASYYNTEVDTFEADRWTAGAVYTYGPGMTFRGSLSYLDVDNGAGVIDADGTSVLLGTQINF